MAQHSNTHASAIILGDRGLIVFGLSGSGKTALCLALLDHCAKSRIFARFVADDQLFLSKSGSRLVAHAPAAIAGKIEVHGYQPTPLRFERQMVVDRMVRLAPENGAPRFGEVQSEIIGGCPIPALHLAARNTAANTRAVLAWFNLSPFDAAQAPDSASETKKWP